MNLVAYTLLLIPPLLWSTMLVVGSSVLGQIPPATLTFWTWLVATLSLFPFALGQLKHNLKIVGQEILPLFFFALFGISGFQFFIYAGLVRSSVISVSVLSPTIPIMVACLGWVFLREKLRVLQSLGVILSFVGACWIATTGDWTSLLGLKLGLGERLILVANLFMAAYTIMLRLYPTQLSPLAFMAIIALIGTIQILPISLFEIGFKAGALQTFKFPLAILYIGIVNYSLAYVFWNMAVKRHGATMTSIFLYLIPIFGTILSIIFLQERLFSYHIVGMIFICLGLFLSLHMNHKMLDPNVISTK